ncbi:hypothetical protein N658DRAFT_498326 [Parathielavia hyrcaniae]|uniref:Uncharacterized protein n=1 Tax=Parathielavia hyrcaniae TaxID=113614 RepID=A0AAN6Q1S2_9PEZI|nr:hypothetical protein N658DRAFT_498326 [Parathielavia hyrcaniae]
MSTDPLPNLAHEHADDDVEEEWPAGPDRDPDVLDERARVLFNPSQVNPVKLVYETDSRFHANMPARYKLMFPVALPHKVNPQIPGPLYCPPDYLQFRTNLHLSVLRPLLMGALHGLLVSDAPVASALGSEYQPIPENMPPTTRSPIWPQFHGVFVDDRRTGMNLKTGYWISRGMEGHGIDAFLESEGNEVYIVQWVIYHIDWRVGEVEDGQYLPIIELRTQGEFVDGKVVFRVSEFLEWS